MFINLILYGLLGAGIGAGVGTVVSSTTDKWDQRNEYAGYGALAGGVLFGLGMLVIEESSRDITVDYWRPEDDEMPEDIFSQENPMRMPMSQRRTYRVI